jgi:hypothetical protein
MKGITSVGVAQTVDPGTDASSTLPYRAANRKTRMRFTNATHPSAEQQQAAIERDNAQPISMVNLLKFRDKAVYGDGRESALSGREAFAIYGQAMTRMVLAAGGKFLFAGDVRGLLIGQVEQSWDQVAIMIYPSFEAMTAITSSAAYAEIHVHREAGLEGQLLIETVRPQGTGISQ